MADDPRHDPDDPDGADTDAPDDSRLELPSLRSPLRRRATTRQLERQPEPVRRTRRPVRLHVPGPVAAVATGLLAGLALVGLTAGGLHACSSLRGTPSCGKPGIVLLLAITAVVVLLGALLLRLLGVASPGSTSFLGVGLAGVLILLALLPVLDDAWVVVVVPSLAAVTFAASWWLTSTYSGPVDGPR